MTVGRIPSVEGGIQPTLLTTKGDIIAASSASNPARLGIGANDTVLTADSTATTGLKWAAPASALNISQVASGSINSGTSLTISGLTQDFIMIQLTGVTWATGRSDMIARINGSSSAQYNYITINNNGTGNVDNATVDTKIPLGSSLNTQQNTSNNNQYMLTLTNSKQAGFTNFQITSRFLFNPETVTVIGNGIFKTAAQVTSVQFLTAAGYTFNGTGTYNVWAG